MIKTLSLVGCGALGAIIGKGIAERLSDSYRLLAVYDMDAAAREKLVGETGAKAAESLEELLSFGADIVIEAAGGGALRQVCIPALKSGSDVIALSVGALADDGFYAEVSNAARTAGKRVIVPSGAIGGLDLMGAVMEAGNVRASIQNIKNPRSLPENERSDERKAVFTGSAREAIARFPKNVNVAVALALATVGVDETTVTVVNDPAVSVNTHVVTLEGDFGKASVSVASVPSPDNPGSSTLAAYSVLSKLRRMAEPIQI